MQAIEFPWNNFTDTVRDAIAEINVSHRATRTLAGPLHAESIYSKPIETANGIEYRIRKELHKLTEKEIAGEQIIDHTIRAIVQAKYKELGGKKPNMVFADPDNHPTTASGVPIHKVRIRVDAKARSIGKGVRQRYIASGKDSNFASMVYAILDEDGNEVRWEHEIITRLEAHERLNANRGKPGESVLAPAPDEPRQFKFALVKNDMLELDGPDGERFLYRVQSLSASEIQLCEHNIPNIRGANRTPFNRITGINSLRTRNAVVVTVTSIGQVRAKRHAAT